MRVAAIRIDVHPIGEIWYIQHIHAHNKPYVATFHVVINGVEQGHCSRERGLPSQSTAHWLTDLWVPTLFLSPLSQ
jgi:hypothetical protein